MAFQDTNSIAGAGEFGLLRGPGSRTVLFTTDLRDGNGEIVVGKPLGVEGRVVVVVANVTEEKGARGNIVKAFDWQGALRSPPGVEVGTRGAAEAGAPPAFIIALSSLVMKPFGVDKEALEEERGTFANRLGTVGFEAL